MPLLSRYFHQLKYESELAKHSGNRRQSHLVQAKWINLSELKLNEMSSDLH